MIARGKRVTDLKTKDETPALLVRASDGYAVTDESDEERGGMMRGKTLITCNASNGDGGLDFWRKIKKGTIVEVTAVEADRVRFIVPGHPSIEECWRPDLIEVQNESNERGAHHG